MQMEASKPSSEKKSTLTGCAVIHDLSEPPPALMPKKDGGQNEKGHPTGQKKGEASGQTLIISCFLLLSHTSL